MKQMTLKIVLLASLLLAASSPAQNAPGIHQDNAGLNGSLNREDLEKLSGNRKPQPQDPLVARSTSAHLLEQLKIPCEIRAAQRIAFGTTRSDTHSKPVETSVYEVACLNSFGHILEVQGSDKPLSISCLKAEETRSADVAAGRQPGFFCSLPENRDVYAMVTSMIKDHTGSDCNVAKLQSFGRSESTQSSYSEVVCQDGAGYLLRTPLPGSPTEASAFSCAQAAQQGIKCRLTTTAETHSDVVTLQTLKDALVRFGVSCAVDSTRLIGQEDHRKRYVLEYRCADKPSSMVAFIPMAGNENPYEALDCATAATSGIQCELGRPR